VVLLIFVETCGLPHHYLWYIVVVYVFIAETVFATGDRMPEQGRRARDVSLQHGPHGGPSPASATLVPGTPYLCEDSVCTICLDKFDNHSKQNVVTYFATSVSLNGQETSGLPAESHLACS
jgi:hypothetical protein